METLIGRIFIPSESANVVIWKDLYKNISSTQNTQQQKAHSSLLAKFQPNRMWNNQGSLLGWLFQILNTAIIYNQKKQKNVVS